MSDLSKRGDMSEYRAGPRRIDKAGRRRRFRMSITIKRDEEPLTPRSYTSLEITDEDAAIMLDKYKDRPAVRPVIGPKGAK